MTTFSFEWILVRGTWDRGLEAVTMTVEAEYSPASRGYREPPYGVPIEPDEPEEVEVVQWIPAIDLTDAEQEEMLLAAEDEWRSRNEPEHEPPYERMD